MLSSLWSVD